MVKFIAHCKINCGGSLSEPNIKLKQKKIKFKYYYFVYKVLKAIFWNLFVKPLGQKLQIIFIK